MSQERFLEIILSPHLSEKAAIGSQKHNQYVFKVQKSASKPEIKLAIESLFNVNVSAVRVLNVKSKARRFGKVVGRTKGWKKAYLTLKDGQQIDFGT